MQEAQARDREGSVGPLRGNRTPSPAWEGGPDTIFRTIDEYMRPTPLSDRITQRTFVDAARAFMT